MGDAGGVTVQSRKQLYVTTRRKAFKQILYSGTRRVVASLFDALFSGSGLFVSDKKTA
jgi:hypothetical protein